MAVTSDAVYIGGHYRWLNNPYGQDNPQKGAVPRPGLAALDPANGVPLSWNPGRNPRGHGAEEIYATPAGIWVGSDTDSIGNYQYKRRSWRSSPSPAARRRPATTPVTRAPVFVAGANGANTFTANTFDPATGAGSVTRASRATAGASTGAPSKAPSSSTAGSGSARAASSTTCTWDGANNFGAPQLVDPYNDPTGTTSSTATADGPTYQGTVHRLLRRTPQRDRHVLRQPLDLLHAVGQQGPVQPRVLARHRRLVGGQPGDRRRHQPAAEHRRPRPAARSISPTPAACSSRAARLWYATKSDGKLHKVAWNGTTYSGPSTVDTSASRQLGGQGRLRLAGRADRVPPAAGFTGSCPNATCFFDGSASTARARAITSYAWDIR